MQGEGVCVGGGGWDGSGVWCDGEGCRAGQ